MPIIAVLETSVFMYLFCIFRKWVQKMIYFWFFNVSANTLKIGRTEFY